MRLSRESCDFSWPVLNWRLTSCTLVVVLLGQNASTLLTLWSTEAFLFTVGGVSPSLQLTFVLEEKYQAWAITVCLGAEFGEFELSILSWHLIVSGPFILGKSHTLSATLG